MAERVPAQFLEFWWHEPVDLPRRVWVAVEPGPDDLDTLGVLRPLARERVETELDVQYELASAHAPESSLYVVGELRAAAETLTVPATEGERREWAEAAGAYLVVAREARSELVAARRAADRWWLRLLPPTRNSLGARRSRRAEGRYRQRIDRAGAAYRPVSEMFERLLTAELARRAAEFAARQAAERARLAQEQKRLAREREQERKRAQEREERWQAADELRVWCYRRRGSRVWIYRADVRPELRLPKDAAEIGPLAAAEFARRLEQLKPIQTWTWDRAATDALEQVIGAGETRAYWARHEEVTTAWAERTGLHQGYVAGRHASTHHSSHGVGGVGGVHT